jgi:hypothetical protein
MERQIIKQTRYKSGFWPQLPNEDEKNDKKIKHYEND